MTEMCFNLVRKSLVIEQQSLQLVRMKTLKEKARLQDVELKAQKLREQLAAAERIRNYRKKTIVTLNKKVRFSKVSTANFDQRFKMWGKRTK